MGNNRSNPQPNPNPQASQLFPNPPDHPDQPELEPQLYYDQLVEYQQCCGFERKIITRKPLAWEENFMENCEELRQYYEWTQELVDVVKQYGRKLPRRRFVEEYNALKVVDRVQPLLENQILLSPSQIDQFKKNLKNSLLLSYGQALKLPRPRQNSKIESVMFNSQSRNPHKSSFSKPRHPNNTINLSMASSFKNKPSSASSRKGSFIDGDQARKDSILRERQRTLRQSFSKSGFRESIMSFVDDTMSTLFRGAQQKQISKQSAHSLQTFVKFTLILQKHLSDKQCIINTIIRLFQNHIYKKYTIFNNTQNTEKQMQLQEQFSQMEKNHKQAMNLQELEQNLKVKAKRDKEKQKDKIKQLQCRKSLSTDQIDDLTSDIKIFLILLRQIVQDYYKTPQFLYQLHLPPIPPIPQTSESSRTITESSMPAQQSTNYLITNQDNILIVVTAILFKNQKFYNHIFNIFKKYHQERERNFRAIVERLCFRPPEYFQVKREYCLDQWTLGKFLGEEGVRNYVSQINQSTGSKVNEGNTTEIDQPSTTTTQKPPQPEQPSTQPKTQQKNPTESPTQSSNLNPSKLPPQTTNPPTKTSTLKPKLPKPYTKCSEILQKLTKSKTPTSKMKTIMQCAEKITESVSEFYNWYNLELENQVLDADQILSIFCYILSSNSVENLHANLFMIEHFATQNQMISVTGYYYSVLTIAIQQLENMYSPTSADMQTLNQSYLTQSHNHDSHKSSSKNQSQNQSQSQSQHKANKSSSKSASKSSRSVVSQDKGKFKGKKDRVKRSFKVIEEE